MSRKASALHLVEKGIHKANLRRIPGTKDEWETGYWWVSDATAASLVGGKIYLHRRQGEPSHIGGEVLSSYHESGTDPKRKVFRFQALDTCVGVSTANTGWGNEKKLIWKP